MDSYLVKPRIYMDRDGLTEILQGRKKAFIVTDRFMHESGKVSYITDICARMGVEVTIFSEIKPDPDIATVTKGISMMVDIKPDVLFALGGGSSIDAAKAMNYLASREGMLEKAYFVAIPTTSGTGSEVTTFAVISDPDKKAKYPLISENMLPDAAVLDVRMTETLPPRMTASTGMDALCHAIEAYTCLQKNPVSDAYASAAVHMVGMYLEQAVKNGTDEEARLGMANASTMAGAAFSNSMVGMVHAIGHALGGICHVPHADAMTVLLPYCMEYNMEALGNLYGELLLHFAGAEAYAEIAQEDRGTAMVQEVRNLAARLHDRCGLPVSLKETSADPGLFEQVAAAALNDGAMLVNPVQVGKADVLEILRRAY